MNQTLKSRFFIFILALGAILVFALPAVAVTGIITGDDVNVRSGPGTDNDVIGSLDTGDRVSVSSSSDGWYKISYNSVNGWVSGDFCDIESATLTVIESTVNLREGPGTDYDKVGTVSRGDALTLLDVAGDWYKVRSSGGITAYVRSDMVQEGWSAPVATPPSSTPAAPPVPRVVLDGRQLTFDVSPTIKEDRVLVPLRVIFEAMGASVSWNESTQTVTAVKGGKTIVMTVNSKTPTVNGAAQSIEVPAQMVGDRVLAPLRFVAEAFGGTVMWDGLTQIAYITSVPGSTPDQPDTQPDTTPPPTDPGVTPETEVKVAITPAGSTYLVKISAADYMKVVIGEEDGKLVYTIKNKKVASELNLSQKCTGGNLTVKASNSDAGAVIEICFPVGLTYSMDTQGDGSVEIITFS